ncbi:MAG: tRNA (N(6)-L-threonylcarbamoyladenosine(37)-C(2))-methylthiotransferase MtaB [Chloroflexi bacterium]|nr:tRNA (N(6)-L-threonylcarbamoyladenosine(37)-C(2))-methylthiotransferase MtaB [Chloroflexota bacterium]
MEGTTGQTLEGEGPRPPVVAVETHGCKLNLADSEALARELERSGCRIVTEREQADVYVLNTCTVTREADSKARQAVRAYMRQFPGSVVMVTGCYAQRSPGELESIPGVSLVVGNRAKGGLAGSILGLIEGAHGPRASGDDTSWPTIPLRHRAMVKIQEGCNQVCAYCIVPKVRGRERSVPPEALTAQVRERLKEGYREVVLTGTQLGSYGFDVPGTSLEALVRGLMEETSLERLRVSSLQPQELTEGLLGLWARYPTRLCPHFHMPLQSSSDAVLRRMRRRYGADLYAETVQRIRQTVPEAAVTTDVIVGFPGETEEDFQRTLDFCQGMGFAAIHVFPYSVRPGTGAAHMREKVNGESLSTRRRALAELGRGLAAAFRQRCVGQVRQVLWERERELGGVKLWEGLTDTYLRVQCLSSRGLANQIAPARLERCTGQVLWAKPLPGGAFPGMP